MHCSVNIHKGNACMKPGADSFALLHRFLAPISLFPLYLVHFQVILSLIELQVKYFVTS